MLEFVEALGEDYCGPGCSGAMRHCCSPPRHTCGVALLYFCSRFDGAGSYSFLSFCLCSELCSTIAGQEHAISNDLSDPMEHLNQPREHLRQSGEVESLITSFQLIT